MFIIILNKLTSDLILYHMSALATLSKLVELTHEKRVDACLILDVNEDGWGILFLKKHSMFGTRKYH